MKLGKREIALIGLAPVLFVALFNYPLMTLCLAWLLGAAYFIYRMMPRPVQPVELPRSEMSCRTEDVLPVETKKHIWFVEKWLWLWNNPNHGWMLFWCSAVIAFPADDIFGMFLDDIAAAILFIKHARDLYELKWGKPPERMLAEHAKNLVTASVSEMGVLPSASLPEGLPARSPR